MGNRHAYHNLHLQRGPFTPSDHTPIIATLSNNPIQIPIKPRNSFHRADWESYQQDLSINSPPTKEHPTLQDIDNYINNFNSQIEQATNNNIPKITYRTIPGIKPNNTIREIQQTLNFYQTLMDRFGVNPELLRLFNTLKHKLRDEYNTLSTQLWNNILQDLDHQEDPTLFWRSIRKLSASDQTPLKYILDDNNIKIDEDKDIESEFRNYYSNIYKDTDPPNNNFNQQNIQLVDTTVTNFQDILIPYDYADINRLTDEFPPISNKELLDTLKTFKQKAPGPSGITTLQLKNLPHNMIDTLITIFNMTISAGYFPDNFKIAEMIQIPKDSGLHTKNFRPISLLETHGKLLDKILNNRFKELINKHNLNNTRQHGFRVQHGTHTALALLYETISNHTAIGGSIDVTLRDVSKAFDRVWHQGLKYKLLLIQHIHPCFLKILTNYLDNRQAKLRINNYIGPLFPLERGVPQGACLSPTLYTFYIHDLPEPITNSDYISFADDITQITFSHFKGPKFIANTTAKAIKQINDFENDWKIQTNTSKFKIILINRYKTHPINVNGTLYNYTNMGKVLGLKLGTFGLRNHIKYRRDTAKATLGKLQRFRPISTKNKLKLYKSLVLSKLTYPPVPLNATCKTNMRTLQVIQNKSLRFATNTHYPDLTTNSALHQRLNIKPLNQILHSQATATWEKLRNNFPTQYNQIVTQSTSTRHRNWPSSRLQAEGPTPSPLY